MYEDRSNGFMRRLDQWTNEEIINKLARAIESDEFRMMAEAREEILRGIREKVLESFKNGLKAQARRPDNEEDSRDSEDMKQWVKRSQSLAGY